MRILSLLALLAGPAFADDVRTIWMHPTEGDPIAAGTVTLATDGSFKVDWADAPFTDHFLSMRPFKCLEGPSKHWCHVPYPYENRRSIADDLTDLEYDLLFLWKGGGEYGINMWNGVYYKLTAVRDGWDGALHEMDMDILAAPPEDGTLRPITPADLEEGDPDSHWLPRITIR